MDGPNRLVPKTKIGEIPPGTKMRVDTGKFIIQLEKDDNQTVLTIEYIPTKGGWGIVKVIDPDPNLALNDIVLSAQVFLGGVVANKTEDSQP